MSTAGVVGHHHGFHHPLLRPGRHRRSRKAPEHARWVLRPGTIATIRTTFPFRDFALMVVSALCAVLVVVALAGVAASTTGGSLHQPSPTEQFAPRAPHP